MAQEEEEEEEEGVRQNDNSDTDHGQKRGWTVTVTGRRSRGFGGGIVPMRVVAWRRSCWFRGGQRNEGHYRVRYLEHFL